LLLNGVVRQPLAVFPVIRLNLENNFLSCGLFSFLPDNFWEGRGIRHS
jgi:hypothetical protein